MTLRGTIMSDKYVKALKLMLEELEYPSRDLRLSAQVEDCKDEIMQVCKWLSKEVEREIAIQTMFD
jgi:hypothetical protein